MKKILTTAVFLFAFFCLKAQTNWVQKQDFPGDSRLLPTTFTISSKGYVAGGYRSSTGQPTNENWEYNAQTNSWSSREPVPGVNRWGAISFAIDGKGYVGGGNTGTPGFPAYVNDFWEYNPATDSWVIKQNIGDHARYQSTGFVINEKGYVALGYRSAQGTRDLTVWKYDPNTNEWTRMGDVPSNMANSTIVADVPAIGFVLDNRAFLTGGAVYSQTWRYNPSTDSWVKRKDVTLNAYSGFAIGNKGYAVGERFVNNQWEDVIMRYDKSSNQWTKIDNLPTQLPSQTSKMFSVTPCETKAIVGSGNGRFYSYENVTAASTSGTTIICNNAQATYSLNNLPNGTTVTWSKSANLSILSGQGTSSVTVEGVSSGSGVGWVRATLDNSCGNLVLDKFNLWVGTPKAPLISGPTLVAANTLKSYQTYPWPGDDFSEQGVTGYQWSFPTLPQSGWQCYQCNSSSTSVLTGTQSSYVSVKLQNSCGWSPRRDYAVTVQQDDCPPRGCEEPFFVYPNPATVSFIVEEGNTSNAESEAGLSGTIQVFNSVNQTILQSAWDNRKVQIDTKSWPKGTYYVKIKKGRRTQTSRLIVE